MAVSEFIKFTLQVNNSGVSQEGFGTPLYISYSATWPEVVRTYSQYADVLADFAIGTPEALAANAAFAQNPHPDTFKIGRGTLPPTQQYTMGAIVVSNATPYQVQVDGPGITSTLASYTSAGTSNLADIHNGVIAALNAVTGKNYLAAFAAMPSLTPFTFTCNHTVPELIHTAHGMITGDGPVHVSNSGGALPTGLVAATDYWVIKIDANDFKLASSLANAIAGTAIAVVTDDGTGTQTLTPQAAAKSPALPFTVTGTGTAATGVWFSLEAIGKANLLSNKETHADPGVATDLAAIALDDPDWYWLLLDFQSKAVQLQAALWTEANGRAFGAQSCDSDALNTPAGNADGLDALSTLGYVRSFGNYHPSNLQHMSSAHVGVIASQVPGKWTAFGKTLSGVAPVKMSATQRVNLRARRSGTYTLEKGAKITWDGKVFSTVYGYLDIVVTSDWFSDAVITAAFGAMIAPPKTAYTDEDLDHIAGAVRGVLHDAASDAHDALDPGDPSDPDNLPPSITFPKVSSISPGTRALRKVPNATITGRFQGAAQEIDFIATLTF